MARHRMSARRRIARVVRRIVLTFAALGAAFVALFVWFLVDTSGTPDPVPTSARTPAPHEVIVSTGISPTGNGTMELRQDGTVRVTGDCIPDDDDFFWPCADLTPINGTDYRGDDVRKGA